MVDWSKTWIGLAGGGFGFSVGAGVGVYGMKLYNMGSNPIPIQATIVGKRLGLTIGAEVAHAVCFMTGVSKSSDFDTLSSSGVDWNISAGVDIDSIIKGGGKVIKALMSVAKRSQAGGWAKNEAAKKAAQWAMGDLGTDFSKMNFYLIPTPAALSVGAGIWYEWQTLYKSGSNMAWKYTPPQWGIETPGGKMLLRMRGIPEPDGRRMCFRIRKDTWGYDDTIRFKPHSAVGNYGQRGTRTANLFGTVSGGRLWQNGKVGRGKDGIDLAPLVPTGETVTGAMSVYTNTDIDKNDTIKIGISVSHNQSNYYKWESDKYIKVTTDGSGRLKGRISPDYWYW